jgi:hypothetical protein
MRVLVLLLAAVMVAGCSLPAIAVGPAPGAQATPLPATPTPAGPPPGAASVSEPSSPTAAAAPSPLVVAATTTTISPTAAAGQETPMAATSEPSATPGSGRMAPMTATVSATAGAAYTTTTAAATPDPSALYQADFTNPASGWPDELQFENYYVGYHEPDNYHVEVHAPADNAMVSIPGRKFDDFAVESQMFVSVANTAPSGDFRYGLAVRRTGNRYYAFAISARTRTWYVLKSGAAGLQVLGQGTQGSIQGLKSPDTLRVNAVGPLLTFYVNDQAVSQVSDSDYGSGEIALYVETLDAPRAHIHFHTLIVRKPGNPLPVPTATPAPVCQVLAAQLYLRSGPGLDNAPIVLLFAGTQLKPVGRSADGGWIRVRVRGSTLEGWVSDAGNLVACSP